MSVEQTYTARLWYEDGMSSYHRTFTENGELREQIELPVKDDAGQLLIITWQLRWPATMHYPDYDFVQALGADSGIPRRVLWASVPPDLGEV
jgi:hypothetical protein